MDYADIGIVFEGKRGREDVGGVRLPLDEWESSWNKIPGLKNPSSFIAEKRSVNDNVLTTKYITQEVAEDLLDESLQECVDRES